MPWFSLIADASRSCDRLPAISGSGPSPFSRASPSFRGLTHSQKGRSNVNQNCKRTSELEVMRSNDNYKNKARRPTKNREF
jgi:hypothetical protein